MIATAEKIEWKRIDLRDRELFEKQILNEEGIAMFSFASMFLWREFYQTSYAVINGNIIAKGVSDDGECVIYFPRGLEYDVEETVSAIRNTYGKNVTLLPLTERVCEKITACFPEAKKSIIDGKCEYVYNRDDLAYLAGKKYHAKRNHIAKFDKNYNAEFIKINKDNVDVLKNAAKYLFELIEGSPENEYKAICDAIEHFEELSLRGGVLTVGGKVVAYSIGSMINDDTADIHFEKADRAYEGSYAKINQTLVLECFEDAKYINREEDLGIEGLRKAKLSYYPCHLNQMYSIKFE